MNLQENIQRIREMMGLNETLYLGRNERVHISINKIESIKDVNQYEIPANGKPNGLWYGFGNQWIYFSLSEFDKDSDKSFKKMKYGYKIYPNMEKIFVLTIDNLENFVDKYLNSTPTFQGYDIDWIKVSQDYSGIEIPRYQESGMKYMNRGEAWAKKRYSWLYHWDVSSGCIWKSDGIARIKEL